LDAIVEDIEKADQTTMSFGTSISSRIICCEEMDDSAVFNFLKKGIIITCDNLFERII
jgi:hypothetical protein